MLLNWKNHWRALTIIALLATVGCNQPAGPPKQREIHSGKPVAKKSIDSQASNSSPKSTDPAAEGPALDTTAADGPAAHVADPAEAEPAPKETTSSQLAKPAQKLQMPKVELPPTMEAHCLVKVGDPMPEIELPNQAGESTSLTSLYGPKATVVLLWSTGGAAVQKMMSQQALEDLGPDVLKPFEEHGARVLAIAVGEPDSTVRTEAEAAGATFPQLIDSEGAAFAKLGTGNLPRVLVLDGQGKIAWFDVEYTRSSRRDLLDAVQFLVHK